MLSPAHAVRALQVFVALKKLNNREPLRRCICFLKMNFNLYQIEKSNKIQKPIFACLAALGTKESTPTKFIVSSHDYEATASDEVLEGLIER